MSECDCNCEEDVCNREENLKHCTCSSEDCSNRGICCKCISYHREKKQLPGCLFPKEAELKHDRSVEYFIEVMSK